MSENVAINMITDILKHLWIYEWHSSTESARKGENLFGKVRFMDANLIFKNGFVLCYHKVKTKLTWYDKFVIYQ